MSAFVIDDTPVRTSVGPRAALLRVWKSRITMTGFYLATLAGLLFVSGVRLDGFDAQPASDPLTEAARPSGAGLGAAVAVPD